MINELRVRETLLETIRKSHPVAFLELTCLAFLLQMQCSVDVDVGTVFLSALAGIFRATTGIETTPRHMPNSVTLMTLKQARSIRVNWVERQPKLDMSWYCVAFKK